MSPRTPSPGAEPESAGELRKASHTEQLLFRMATVDLLRLAKSEMTYREIARMLGYQITVVCRYVKGHVIPSVERSTHIWSVLEPRFGLKSIIMQSEPSELSRLAFDPSAVKLAAYDCLMRYAGHRVTKVLTAGVNGVPLAATISQIHSCPLVVAKDHMDVDVREYIQVLQRAGERLLPLYVPKDALRRQDAVLIVDDAVRTGGTVRMLAEVCDVAGAEVAGVYCLIAFRQGVEELRARGLRVESVLEVKG
ncbi:MAG: phosphoribosyltransferase family protein [Thermofilaceae archaeon]